MIFFIVSSNEKSSSTYVLGKLSLVNLFGACTTIRNIKIFFATKDDEKDFLSNKKKPHKVIHEICLLLFFFWRYYIIAIKLAHQVCLLFFSFSSLFGELRFIDCYNLQYIVLAGVIIYVSLMKALSFIKKQ